MYNLVILWYINPRKSSILFLGGSKLADLQQALDDYLPFFLGLTKGNFNRTLFF